MSVVPTSAADPVVTHSGVLFVSLGARVMTPEYLNSAAAAAAEMCRRFEICILDEPELLNLVHLECLPVKEALGRLSENRLALVEALEDDCDPGRIVTFSSHYATLPEVGVFRNLIFEEYANNDRFARNCRNQVYQNLHPILRRKGAMNSRAEITEHLAPYLLEEVALKLYFANKPLADLEFGPEPEMEIMLAIYEGKYASFRSVIHRRLTFVVVPPPVGYTPRVER